MQYQIEYASEADAPALGQINTLSFSGRSLFPNVFPGSSLSTLQAYKAKHALKHFADPTTHVVKVADPTSGDIIGYGRWHISKALAGTSVPELSEEAQAVAQDPLQFAPQPMNESLLAAFKDILDAARKRHTTEKDIVLGLLATLPDYQRRGVGTAMLQWGMQLADAWQARIYLESTPEGYPVYLKHGWKPVEELTLDFSEHGGEGTDQFLVMMRDPLPVS